MSRDEPVRLPPYVPPAAEPGPKADGFTREWAAEITAMKRERAAREPDVPHPSHARPHRLRYAVAHAVGTVLIAVGSLLVAVGTAAQGWLS